MVVRHWLRRVLHVIEHSLTRRSPRLRIPKRQISCSIEALEPRTLLSGVPLDYETTTIDQSTDSTASEYSVDLSPLASSDSNDIPVGELGNGVAANDRAEGISYLLYSAESVYTRLNNEVIPGNADHFVQVQYQHNGWQFAKNDRWLTFTPVDGDRLIARIDHDADTVTMLQGATGEVEGIKQGYSQSDLQVTLNVWAGNPNPGEFSLTGTFINFETSGQQTNQPPSVTLTNVVTSIPEETAFNTRLKVADIEITDDGLGINTLGLTGADAGLFERDGLELFLKQGTVLDYTSNPQLDVAVTVDDVAVGQTPDDTATLTIQIVEFVSSGSVPVGELGNGVAANDRAEGISYLLYSEESVYTRLNNEVIPGNADHFVQVQYQQNGWQFAKNDRWLTFTPVDGDRLIARIDHDADTVTMLQGAPGEVEGIAQGYSQSDLQVTLNVWAGNPNPGEFSLTGTFINFETPSQQTNQPPSVTLTNVVTSIPEETVFNKRLKVANIEITDDGLGINTLGLTGADAGLFERDGLELFLKQGTVLDYASNPQLDVAVTVDDVAVGQTPDDTATLTIQIVEFVSSGSVPVGELGNGVAANDRAEGISYLLYSAESVYTRLNNEVIPGNADHFVQVQYQQNGWQFAKNDRWLAFTPVDGDRLIARIDHDADTVTMLQGVTGEVEGIEQGYSQSDLQVTLNVWAGTPNPGEFSLTGTFIEFEVPNQPPQVIGNPGVINLNGDQPSVNIDLIQYFTDAEDQSLAFRVTSPASQLCVTSIVGSILTITGQQGGVGNAVLKVEAVDSADASAELNIAVNVDLPALAPLDSVQYALTSDQVMDYGGQNTFVIKTNFDESSRIRVESTNEIVLNADHIDVTSLGGGEHRVTMRHGTSSFGLSFIKLVVESSVISEFALIVLPDSEITFDDVGVQNFSYTHSIDESGLFYAEHEFNDLYLAKQLADGIISVSEAFQFVRAFSQEDAILANALTGSTHTQSVTVNSDSPLGDQIVGSNLADTLPPRTTRVSFSARVTERLSENTTYNFGNIFYSESGSTLDFSGINVATSSSPFKLYASIGAGSSLTEYFSSDAFSGNYFGIDPQQTKYATKFAIESSGISMIAGPGYQADYQLRESLVDYVAGQVPGEFVSFATGEAIELALKTVGFASGLASGFSELATAVLFAPPVGESEQYYLEAEKFRRAEFTAKGELANSIVSQKLDSSSSILKEVGIEIDDESSQIAGERLKTNQEAIQSEIETGKENFAEQIEQLENGEIPSVDVPSDFEPGPINEDEKNSEAQGENGDEQERINEEINKYTQLEKAVGVGKKLFDIAKSVQGIADSVEQLFGSAGDDDGYYDNGESTKYYLDQRQVRTGTPGRDNINTGYKNDEVRAGEGNDKINTLGGDDKLFGGEGRNSLFAGAGDDELYDKSGNSYLSAGAGDDYIEPGAGDDVIEGGTGDDTIVYNVRDTGKDLIIDPSRKGTIKFLEFTIDQIDFRKDRYDLEIILPSDTGRNTNAVRLVSFFEQDAAGWEIVDQLGNRYSLYELTGRITAYEALEVAFQNRTDSTPVYPADVVHLQTIQDDQGRFTVHIAEDRRLIGVNSGTTEPRLFLTFEGDQSLDGWLSRNQLGSLEVANELLGKVLAEVSFSNYESVTVVGQGEGGLIAQWFAAAAATSGTTFVNAQLINTPDISGLISQVVRNDFPEYTEGFPVLSTIYLVSPKDWISQIGLWAGNDELYATWKAFSFEENPGTDGIALLELDDIAAAHAPDPSTIQFDDLQINDMDLSQVRGVVSMLSVEDMNQAFANTIVELDGEQYDSTTNARLILIDDDLEDPDFDIVDDTLEIRNAFVNRLAADPTAIDPDAPFSLSFDFQASEQLGEHLANGHDEVTEDTLYNPDATALRLFGWADLAGVKAGKDKGKATSLERDSVKVKDATFIVDLTGEGAGPGTYNVSITMGDREEIQESLQVWVDGYAADRVSTMPGDFLTRTYQINTLDSQLRISFEDLGGEKDYFSINGITIEKVNYRAINPVSEQLDNDPSIVIITQSYDLPESSAGIEIYKEALKAAAMAALTAGAGAVLQAAAPALASIGSGISGSFAAGAAAAKNATFNGIVSAIGQSAAKSAGWSLVTSVPQNLVSDPTARGIISGATSIFFGGLGIDSAGQKITETAIKQRDVLKQINGGLKVIQGGLTIANTVVASARGQLETSNTAPWVFEAVSSLQQMSQRFRLGKLDAAFVPVDLEEVEQAIDNGKSLKQILRLWQGSRDFLVLDWIPTGDQLTEVGVDDHLDYVRRSSRVLKKLIEAYSEQLTASNPEAELDLLFISHGAGYEINRETVNRLNNSDVADALDYVKLVTLDPYASSQKAFTWYHPEMTNIVDRIDNVFQTEEVDSSLWVAALIGAVSPASGALILIGADPGGSELYHGGSSIGGLDGRIGGGSAGFYNRQARIFDLNTNDEILRFRHWDPNEVSLSTAELTDIEFSPDGSLIAASGKDGIVTVRYVEDVIDEETGEVIHAAGTNKFIVWGQEAIVRSLAFVEIEVDGEWKDFLLTISAARNPENTDIDKNKILLTDLETGLPVWQGKDVKGTQVEASPTGNIFVSTDANGNAKVWKRNGETLIYENIANIDAHPADGGSYVTDVVVISDQYFVTAGGPTERVKLFEIVDNQINQVDVEIFDNPDEGRVRNLDYDPYNGILAVGAGRSLSFWTIDRDAGKLNPFAPEGVETTQKFSREDHVAAIQGISFSKPKFLLDADGQFLGDRSITLDDGTEFVLPRFETGEIDVAELRLKLQEFNLPSSFEGLQLLTGGEDKTLFLYSLDRFDIGLLKEETVLSGSMLPIREVTLSADGTRVAVVGQDNVDGDDGGPVKDIDVTGALDDRLGWQFSEIFLQGRREHNAVPQQYIYDIIEQKGESFFWLRNSKNANRPGDLDKDKNLALPPNKRGNVDGVDVAPIDLYLRPGQKIDIKPLHYLLEADRSDYELTTLLETPQPIIKDGVLIGEIKNKRVDGNIKPNIFVFEAADDFDFSQVNEFTGSFDWSYEGPVDLDGNAITGTSTINFRVINFKPVAYRDIVNLHPGRSEDDFRPRKNDYDFDNDDFSIIPLPNQWQSLQFEFTENGTPKQEVVGRYRRNGTSDAGVDIEITVESERLTELLAFTNEDFITAEINYEVEEKKYKTRSEGIVEVRIQQQEGPGNVASSELGADRVLITWDPVTWNADKYVIQRFDDLTGEWVKHSTNSDVDGKNSDSKRIAVVPNSTYYFRVVAKNTKREVASHENKEDALFVSTPDYVGPDEVFMETLGANRIEVSWEKVYWDVSKYIVELSQIELDAEGNLKTDADGNYLIDETTTKTKEVDADSKRSTTFRQLDPGTWYLATVTAKRGDIEQATVAERPARTAEKDIPAGIDFERIGPEKIKVSWATVSFASRYRVVAIDPNDPLNEVRPTKVVDPDPGNTNTAVIDGLTLDTEYVIIVEAKDPRSGKWISVISNEDRPTVIENVPVAEGESQFDVSSDVAPSYIALSDFAQDLRLPSLEGLFVGTEFTFINFGRQSFSINAFAGELISLGGLNRQSHELQPAVERTEDNGEGNGIIVYRFVVDSTGEDAFWKVITSDNTSEARVVRTPVFRAIANDTIQIDEEESLPRRPRIWWDTPFWNVNRHKIEIFTAEEQNGEWVSTGELADATVFRQVNPGDPIKRYHQFTGLEPDTVYIVRITTTGEKTITEDFELKTDSQGAPKTIEIKDETLMSFTATWQPVEWNTQGYRVVLFELSDDGQRIAIDRPEFELGPNKQELLIDRLTAGKTYEFTVEAYSGLIDGWVENDNIKTVTLQSLDELEITGLNQGPELNKKLDMMWNPLDFVPKKLFFEVREVGETVFTKPANGDVLNVENVSRILEGFKLNTSYEVRLVAQVEYFDATDQTVKEYTVESEIFVAKTKWGIFEEETEWTSTSVSVVVPRIEAATHFQILVLEPGTDNIISSNQKPKDTSGPNSITVNGLSPETTYEVVAIAKKNGNELTRSDRQEVTTRPLVRPEVTVQAAEVERRKFLVEWTHDDPFNDVRFTITVSPDGGANYYTVKNGVGKDGTNLPGTDTQFRVSRLEGLGELEPGTDYLVQIAALYADGAFSIGLENPITVTTLPTVKPSNVQVAAVGPTSVQVSWQHPGGNDLDVFKVYKKNQAGDWVLARGGIDPPTTSITLTNADTRIEPGISYEFYVAAKYDNGDETPEPFSPEPIDVHPVTMPAATPPSNVREDVAARGRHSVTIRWDAPSPSWDLDRYKVELYLKGTTTNPVRSPDALGSGARSYTFTGLEAGTEYDAVVSARNPDLNASAETRITVETAPKVGPDNVSANATSPASVLVRWNHDGIGVDVFKIYKRNQAGDWVLARGGISSNLRELEIDNDDTRLEPGITYGFRVAAKFNNGDEVFQDGQDRFLTLPEAVPPGNARATGIRRQQIDVAWDSVAKWAEWTKVRWRKVGSSNWSGSGQLGGARTDYTITGLDRNTAYEIEVSAGREGKGEETSFFVTTKDFVQPSAPTASSISQTSITLQWNHSDPAGAPDKFAIFRNGSKIGEVNSATRTFVVNNLSPNTAYSFFIRAVYPTGSVDGQVRTISTPAPVYYAPTSVNAPSNLIKRQQFTLNWNFVGDPKDLLKFEIYRINNNGVHKLFGNKGDTSDFSFVVQDRPNIGVDIKRNTEYVMYVRAIYKDGTIRNSSTITVRTLP